MSDWNCRIGKVTYRHGPHLRRVLGGYFSPNTPQWRKFCYRRDAVRRATARWGMSDERAIAALVATGADRGVVKAMVELWHEAA